MKPTKRYRATNELQPRIVANGRRQDWLAAQAGISGALLTRVIKGERTIAEPPARVLAAILGQPFGLLFELANGSDLLPIEQADADEPELAQVAS